MTRLDRIALVGLTVAALVLVSLSLLAWNGSFADDAATPRDASVEAPGPPSPTSTAVPPPPASPQPDAVHWPMAKLMRTVDGVRIRVGSTVVRVQAETTLCSGDGPPVRRNGRRFWNRFRCTFTTFEVGAPERDVDFRVHPLGPRKFSVSDARWIGG